MSQYLVFEDVTPPDRSTRILEVQSARTGDPLGDIRWYGRWRQYAFYPEPGTIFNPDCLETINGKIRELMAARKAWREALAQPSFRVALDAGLADLAAGRTERGSV